MTAKLSGKALSERARELGIVGRSKLSADELRAAVILAEQIEADEVNEGTATAETPTEEKEVFHTVPNRADKRRAKRARKLRNDGSMKTTHPNFKPREVPVRVIHSGH